MAETIAVFQTRFEAAVRVIQSLPKNGSFQPSNEMMLKFYSFYKQATLGPCNVSKPAFWDPVGRYKWDAWHTLGDMSKEEAMIAYVDEMKKILETMPMTEKVEELLQVIGPFYEIVEDKKHGRGSGVSSELNSVLTSTPNCKAVNGKAESSDSGAESEGESTAKQEEDEGDEEESDQEDKCTEQDPALQTAPVTTLANGSLANHSEYIHLTNQTPSKSALNEDGDEVGIKTEVFGEGDLVNVPEKDKDDDADDLATAQHLMSDSDSEIFCDSMEQLGHEEVDHSQMLEDAMLTDDTMEPSAGGEIKDGGEDRRPSGEMSQKEKLDNKKSDHESSSRGIVSRTNPVGGGFQGGHMGSSGDGERRGAERNPSSSLTEQINFVLMRLQEDMQNVLQRLHALEALTASQARSLNLESNYKRSAKKTPSWLPFGFSPGTLAFAIVWPFVAHWLMHVYLQRKRRKPS